MVDCCYCQHLNMRTPDCWEATCCWCVHSSVSNVAPHWLCFKPLRQAVFQVSKPSLQQSFTCLDLSAAVFQVSKPCSSLSCIQHLQQSFTYPNLAACSLSRIQTLPAAAWRSSSLQITDFNLCYTIKCGSVRRRPMMFSISYSTNKCSWNRHNSSVKLLYFVVWLIISCACFCLHSSIKDASARAQRQWWGEPYNLNPIWKSVLFKIIIILDTYTK